MAVPAGAVVLSPLRRRLVQGGGAALIGAPWLLTRPAGAAVVAAVQQPVFTLGVASGHPRADGMVLWTRLLGAALPERVEVRWELATDEAFRNVVASGLETADAAAAHSVHAEPAGLEPARWYFYRFTALGQRSPAGRTRTAPAADAPATLLDFAIASCQRFDAGHYAAWRHLAADGLDLVLFLGDYIYETASPPEALRRVDGGRISTLAGYRDRYAAYKSDPDLQAAHAAAPWLMVWDDHEVDNDYAGLIGQGLQPDFAQQRAAAYQAYWEHMPFPKSARPRGPLMRITGRLDWGRLARIHLLDDRQYRDPQACPRPGRGGSNTVALNDCPALLDPRRSLLGAEQERWLADGWALDRPWNLVGQQTLMARFSATDTAAGGATHWTDGWDGYAPARRRLLATVAERKVPGVVVLGGDVHANYVADLKPDFDVAAAPVVATEFCGTSITSPSLAQARIDAARAFNPHVHFARGDQRGYVRFRLGPAQLQAQLKVLDDVRDPASNIGVAARFVVDAARPGAVRA